LHREKEEEDEEKATGVFFENPSEPSVQVSPPPVAMVTGSSPAAFRNFTEPF